MSVSEVAIFVYIIHSIKLVYVLNTWANSYISDEIAECRPGPHYTQSLDAIGLLLFDKYVGSIKNDKIYTAPVTKSSYKMRKP